jgi:hypothetical protein
MPSSARRKGRAKATRGTQPYPRWIDLMFWVVVAITIVSGVLNILGIFGSSNEQVSYIVFAASVAVILARSMVIRKRLRGQK